MKSFLRIASTIILSLGTAVSLLGVVMIAYGVFAPADPPPSLNEGHGYAFVLGLIVALVGIFGVALGRAMDPRVKPAEARPITEPHEL